MLAMIFVVYYQNVGLIWIQTVLHSDSVLKEFFEYVVFFKNISRHKKSMENYPACKKLITNIVDSQLAVIWWHSSEVRPEFFY